MWRFYSNGSDIENQSCFCIGDIYQMIFKSSFGGKMAGVNVNGFVLKKDWFHNHGNISM